MVREAALSNAVPPYPRHPTWSLSWTKILQSLALFSLTPDQRTQKSNCQLKSNPAIEPGAI